MVAQKQLERPTVSETANRSSPLFYAIPDGKPLTLFLELLCDDQQSIGVSVSGGMSCSDSEAIMKLHMRFT